MAKRNSDPGRGSLLLAEEQLERGDPAFVDELRRSTDADRLGAFAARWYADRRPESRHLLADYLSRPLNAIRHEALVKRLFKLADKAGDDQVMGWFMAALDRSVRRGVRQHFRYDYRTQTTFTEEYLQVPRDSTMPRPTGLVTDRFLERRLFSVLTRNYLRRRAWRYFRRLGKFQPERYVPAVAAALKRYEDTDVATGPALLDNWGLVHVLYHHSPELTRTWTEWRLGERGALSALKPAPMYEALWHAAPRALVGLVSEARCRPVRQWAIQLLQRDHQDFLANLPVDLLLVWLGHESPEVVQLAATLLRGSPVLAGITFERWLTLLQTSDPTILMLLTEIMAEHFAPERVSLPQAAELARQRSTLIARLGLGWLQTKSPRNEEDCNALLALVHAQAGSLRREMVHWARGVLAGSPYFQSQWLLEYLDSRHREVRDEGWAWLTEEVRAHDDVQMWRRLLETPYDDVRLRLLDYLQTQPVQTLEGVQFLWAGVLCNIHRGAKHKPTVVRQIVQRLGWRPEEAPALLPLVGVVLRSVRGPEFRAGLAGVVQLVTRHPELGPLMDAAFPELRWQAGAA